jgi:probable HAF family extracellular repeat protein
MQRFLSLVILLLLALAASAQTLKFGRLSPPGANYTTASGLNNKGIVVGSFGAPGKQLRGFSYNVASKTYTTINFPGSLSTIAMGVNDRGRVAGTFQDTAGVSHGYFFQNGHYTQYDLHKGEGTGVLGIDANGDFAGFSGANGAYSGLVSIGGKATTFTVDGNATEAYAVNSHHSVVGFFVDPAFTGTHGFLRDEKGNVTQIDFPGSTTTGCTDITDGGIITGFYEDAAGNAHGFILSGGKYHSHDVQYISGINDHHAFAGSVIGKDGLTYGFLARPVQ